MGHLLSSAVGSMGMSSEYRDGKLVYAEQVSKGVSKAEKHLMCWWVYRAESSYEAFRFSVKDEINTLLSLSSHRCHSLSCDGIEFFIPR